METMILLILVLLSLSLRQATIKPWSKAYFKIQLTLDLFNLWFSLSTPGFANTAPDHRPSLIPKWKIYRWQNKAMLHFDWIFHFSMAWNSKEEVENGNLHGDS